MNKFQKKEIQNIVVFFPEDVIIDILLRLPSKSLVRSRCVSKYWNTLITSPSFIKAHLHRSSKLCHLLYHESKHSKPILHPLFALADSDTDEPEEKSVSKLKMRFSGCSEFSDIDPPPAIRDGFNLVDSFNGIACLYAVNEEASTVRIWLWNPAINDCFAVPEPRLPISSSAQRYCVGFGFNPLTSHLDDFKVVSVTLYDECEGDDDKKRSSSKAEIYSRRTNSWKEIVGWFPKWYTMESGKQVIFEEYILWSKGRYTDMKTIVSFNVVSEKFHEMTLPDSIPSYDYGWITLLDGCVSLLAKYSNVYEVWTLKEFGNIESWNKLYRFDMFSWPRCSQPLGFATADEALFLSWRYGGRNHLPHKFMVSYNTRTRTFDRSKTISFDSSLFIDCCVKLYMESLIPVSYISM